MDRQQAEAELKKVHSVLAMQGLPKSLEEYIHEHEDRIVEISAGVWDEETASEYIGNLKDAANEIKR